MEIYEQVYERGNHKKNWADTNHTSHSNKFKGGEAVSPSNPNKGLYGMLKEIYEGHPINSQTSEKK